MRKLLENIEVQVVLAAVLGIPTIFGAIWGMALFAEAFHERFGGH